MVQAKKPKKSTAKVPAVKQRDTYLDALKGFAIILVVLGHSVQSFTAGGRFDDNLLFRIIYSFHMPLFMFLSGAAASYSSRPMNLEFIKRKFYMLVIPFVAWYLVGYFLEGSYHTTSFGLYIKHVIVSPDYGLWFLWVLFLNFCCLVLIKRLTSRLKLYAYPLIWLAIYAIPTGKYGIGLVKWHLPFFLAGYLIFTYRTRLARYRTAALAASVVAFPLLVASWHRLYNPAFVNSLPARLAHHHLAMINAGSLIVINLDQIVVVGYTYLVAFAGIGFSCALFKAVRQQRVRRSLAFLGLYTLDIYVAHFYFFRFAFGHGWTEVTSGFIIAISLSFALGYFVLRRVYWLNVIFLGGRGS